MSEIPRGTFFGAACPRYIVIGGNLSKKQNSPKSMKSRHETREDAEAEARRLAAADPGSLWYVAYADSWFRAEKSRISAVEVAS
jgi:hypothetical protein